MADSIIWGSFLGARIMRAIVFWCPFWGPPILGNSHRAVSLDWASLEEVLGLL